jgi:hypothetical protein
VPAMITAMVVEEAPHVQAGALANLATGSIELYVAYTTAITNTAMSGALYSFERFGHRGGERQL